MTLSTPFVKLNKYLAGQETVSLTVTVPAGYKLVGFEGGTDGMRVDGNLLMASLTGSEPVGTRFRNLYPVLQDASTGQQVTLPTAVRLTLQVYNSGKLGVFLSAKGKLDTLYPDGAITYTPRLTNCSGTIETVSLAGQDAGKFNVEAIDGSIVLTLKEGVKYATNVTYKVQSRISVCGQEILSPVTNVRVTQSNIKLTASPTALTLYQSQKTPLTFRLTQSVGEIDEISISSKTSKELLAALGENSLETDLTGNPAVLKLTVKNAAGLKVGRSYSLCLDVTPKNKATNLKPTQIMVNVKVMK